MTRWTTRTEAMVHITTYRIDHPTTGDLYRVCVMRREPIDCYSRTLQTCPYEIGTATSLAKAKALAEKHERENRQEDDV
jgi:hypothetical protein